MIIEDVGVNGYAVGGPLLTIIQEVYTRSITSEIDTERPFVVRFH